MKLKFVIHKLVAASLIFGAAYSVSSCKDNDADLYAQLTATDADLQKQIDELTTKVGNCKKDCHDQILSEVNQILAGYQLKGDYVTQTRLTEILKDYVLVSTLTEKLGNYYTKTEVDKLLEGLTKCECKTPEELLQWLKEQGVVTDDQIKDFVDGKTVDDKITEALKDILTLQQILDEVAKEGYIKADALADYAKKSDLEGLLKQEDLNGYLKTEDLDKEISKLIESTGYTSIVDALTHLSQTETELSNVSGKVSELDSAVSGIQETIQNIQGDIKNIKDDLDKIQKQIDAITGRINSLITSIVCQQIYNPVFGSLNLPFDVTSNILIGYYGTPENEVMFPDSDTLNAYNGNNGLVLTDDDLEFLMANCNLQFEEWAASDKLFDGNVGYVYLTVNPVANDFSGASFSLENSRGEKSVVKLEPIAESTDLISFGYSRAANGFYEAKASVDPNDVSKLKIDIEPGLKDAVVDAVKNHTASDLANLGKLVYRQMDGILPALAICASWKDGDKQNSVYSQYNIAATAFTPLSYSFLYDKSFKHDWKLPEWDYTFEFTVPTMTWTIPSIYIDTESLKLNIDPRPIKVQITDEDNLYVIVEMPTFDSQGHKIGTHEEKFYADNVEKFCDSFNKQITKYMDDVLDNDVRPEFDRVVENLSDQMKREVDKMMHNLESQIEDNMKDVIADINRQINDKISKFTGKLDKFTPKVEKVLNKINKFLENPNHYLQPCMFYGANNSSYGRMSTSKAFPSQFVLKGGDALTLIPSSYNAEIIAPAFRKFIAVTNVYVGDESAQGGNAACKAALVDANKQPYMCEVIAGNRTSVPLKLTKVGGKNTTYEIVYQALDYHGKISTIKCYATVK